MVNPAIRHPAVAHYGWLDWLSQRVTAVVMALYTLLLLGIVLWHGGIDHGVFKSVFANAGFKLATFVFMVALLYHAWVGVRNIAMDYIKHSATRLLVQVVVICLLIAYTGWTIQVLWG
jgi:succinate dehydrogenase / fumarate reductase membrane anchor subunit